MTSLSARLVALADIKDFAKFKGSSKCRALFLYYTLSMSTTIVTLLAVIALLAFIFFKTKADRKPSGKFHNDGRRKTFKDFQKEQLENDPDGIYGEAASAQAMAQLCNEDGRAYVLLKNLYIPSHGGTTEMDTLLLHQSGIYVLESKNIAGEITGHLEDERWNQRLNARTEHTFHNPIQQNAGHIRALKHFLKDNFSRSELHVDELDFYSIIVFSDRCVLRQVPAQGEDWMVLHLFQMKEKISRVLKSRRIIFNKSQLEDLYIKLKPCTQASEKTKVEHRNYIRKSH